MKLKMITFFIFIVISVILFVNSSFFMYGIECDCLPWGIVYQDCYIACQYSGGCNDIYVWAGVCIGHNCLQSAEYQCVSGRWKFNMYSIYCTPPCWF